MADDKGVGRIQNGAPRVPERNNAKESVLYRNSRALELQNRDPNFVYEFKTTEADHPGCLTKSGALSNHEYGTDIGGFVTIAGWEVVHRQVDAQVKAIEQREDQGKPVDTLIRFGDQVLCRLPRSEYEKYKVADAAYQAEIEKQVYSPERRSDGNTSMTAVVSRDENADQMRLLRDSGHPIPGIT